MSFRQVHKLLLEREREMLLNWTNNGIERELAQEWKTFYSIIPLLNIEEFALGQTYLWPGGDEKRLSGNIQEDEIFTPMVIHELAVVPFKI